MNRDDGKFNRRDFIKGASLAALGAAMGVSPIFADETETVTKSRVVLVRDKDVIRSDGSIDGDIIRRMLDGAVMEMTEAKTAGAAWKMIIKPDDTVGIKTNVWGPLPTTSQVENAIKSGVMRTGVPEDHIAIDDRGVLDNDIFLKATALINARPLRAHHWSGVGGLLKNYIMFVPRPWEYHDDSCADLATLWRLPLVEGKTRLNVLVMLTPQFHCTGAHHFQKEHTWPYGGLLVGYDPVALDAVGLRIFDAKRKQFFGKDSPLKPPAHHVAYAESRHHLGYADMNKIDLVRLGWDEGTLI